MLYTVKMIYGLSGGWFLDIGILLRIPILTSLMCELHPFILLRYIQLGPETRK